MPSMDLQKILQDLNRRFAASLPEFYKRRIIFWYDEDREFEDRLDEIVLDNAKLVVLTGRNTFSIKKLLSYDDLTSNFLVYDPLSYSRPDDNWLLDIELYSEEFRADLLSIWMNELGIPGTPILRKQARHYRSFLKAKDRRAKIASQKVTPGNPAQLSLAVMAAVCGIKDATPSNILRCVLQSGLDMATNPIYSDFCVYGADADFWKMVVQGSGYSEDECNLGRLAIHLILSGSTRTLRQEYLAGLESYFSIAHQAYCYDFISEWLHSDEVDSFYEIARYAEDKLRLPQRFANLEIEDLLGTECFPCINEVILAKLMTAISDHIIDVDIITATVEKRRTYVWYDYFESFYDGLLQVARMQEFFKEHSEGFHVADPKTLWKEYTDDYYRMDTYYRQFHLAFQKSLETSNLLLDDLFKHVVDKVEGLYNFWFLGNLSNNWTAVSAETLAETGQIDVPQQTNFYRHYVRNSETRVFVIVSDALRYEVATSLAQQLQRETQSNVALSSMQSIFPSITKFGMAALLPHKDLTVELRGDTLSVFADGLSTASTNRDKVLKSEAGASVALQYKNIIGMKRADRQALVKGMDVVYIYHDTIDDASHHSDSAVFTACDKAISELKNLVRIIVNEFGGTNVIITADHGFLYTYSPLTEDEKVDKTSFGGKDVEYGRRYAIMQKDAVPDYLVPIQFLGGKTEYSGYAPRENTRIKMSGGGLNFVHGGVSLQEIVVPVIEYRYLRNNNKEYMRNRTKYDTKPVSISLLSANRKVSNMIFSLNFYQQEAVSANREAATYTVYFTNSSGKQISDIQKIIADKSSENAQDRTFRCSFNLKNLQYNSYETYYLVITDESGLQPPQREEFQIDIAFALDDYGFFN